MIFMHRETGELYELLILSVEDVGLIYPADDRRAYGIGDFTLYGFEDPQRLTSGEFTEHFECLGWL